MECAVPDCYRNCSLFVRRADGKCARFAYGIWPNRTFAGHYDFGADVRFRRWGKLETFVDSLSVPIPRIGHSLQQRFARLPSQLQSTIVGAWRAVVGPSLAFDDFVIECYAAEPTRLYLEYVFRGDTRLKRSLDLRTGRNFFTIPFTDFAMHALDGLLRVAPEDAQSQPRIIFTWLDFVKYRTQGKANAGTNGGRLKCIVWDLDRTLWDGVLAESDDPSTLQLRPNVRHTIEALDSRGVIQSIASKNDHDLAWKHVIRLGLSEYFVHPMISWHAKSESISLLSEKLNIACDTIALIDDSPLERSEIETLLPKVRTYPESDLAGLLRLPELDLPITSASALRRQSYHAEVRRQAERSAFTGDYEAFLLSCQMRLEIFQPDLDDDITRAWELVQRSNQLNLSNRRYSRDEFNSLLRAPDICGFAFRYTDRFGDYGIVGFASLRLAKNHATLMDLVISCRVAQRQVEYALVDWLATKLTACGYRTLFAHARVSARNAPLRDALSQMPFAVVTSDEREVVQRLDLTTSRSSVRVVAVEGTLDVPPADRCERSK